MRKNYYKNQFRDMIIDSINTGVGDKVVLCSGFFQESKTVKGYKASEEPGFSSALVANRVSLVTVGIHNYNWRKSYEEFRDGMASKGVKISDFYKKGMHWHSKIFLLIKNNEPILGIVGSSNITRNAFSSSKPFNNECDVILWTRKARKFSKTLSSDDNLENAPGIIRTNYDSKQNYGLSIEQRLKQLYDEVLGQNLAPL